MGNCSSKSNQTITSSITKIPRNKESSLIIQTDRNQGSSLIIQTDYSQHEEHPVISFQSLKSIPSSRQVRPLLHMPSLYLNESQEAETARMTDRHKTEFDTQMLKKSLRSQFIFNTLQTDTINEIISKMKFFTLEPKTEIMTQGKPGNNFYIVASGRLDIITNGKVTGTLSKGQGFGEISLIHDTPRPCTVVSATFCNLWGLSREDYRACTQTANNIKYKEIKVFISSVPLLENLSPVQKESLVELLVPQEFKDGQIIVQEGDSGDLLYMIQKGSVNIYVKGEFCRSLVKGEFFGEQALLYGVKRTATVTAAKKVTVLTLHRDHIAKVFGDQLQTIIFKNTIRIAIERSEPLKSLSKKQAEGIMAAMKLVSHRSEETLIEKGSLRGVKMFILVKGHLTHQGKTMGFASCIGDIDMMHNAGGKYTENFLCEGSCEIAEISRTELEKSIGGTLKSVIEKNLLLSILNQVQLFRTLPVYKMESLKSSLKTKEFTRGQYIFHQNDPANNFYIIKEGEVEIIKDGLVLRVEGKNDYFGERGVLLQEIRSASARAKDTVVVWVLYKDDFLRIIDVGMREQLLRRIRMQDDKFKLNDIKILKKIVQSEYGNIFLGLNTGSRSLYAIKAIPKRLIIKNELEEDMKNERKILMQVDHPFIIKLAKTLKDDNRIYFIFEYIRGTLLLDTLRLLDILKLEDARFYIACIVLMLEHLHERNIIFRDLKPENLMVDEEGYLKLMDFGAAKVIEGKTFSLLGTPHYVAPEIIMGKGYGLPADIWSLGIITYELVTGSVPYGNNDVDPYKIYEQILEGDLAYPDMLRNTPKIKIFIDQLLSRNPANRRTAEELKQNKIFAGLNWEELLCKNLKPPYIPIVNSFFIEMKQDEYGDVPYSDIFDLEEGECLEDVKRELAFDPNWDEDF